MRRTLALTVLSAVMVGWVFSTGRDFLVTGMVDLGIHELGHMLAIPLGQTIHFLAGSGTQILAPAGLAGYFWWKGDEAASGLMLAWCSTSIKDVAIYMADAKTRYLPLIGGTHDWWWLFSRWDNLDGASGIAGFVGFLGLMLGAGAILWLGSQSWTLWSEARQPVFVFLDADSGD
jgi:hypothetical protein